MGKDFNCLLKGCFFQALLVNGGENWDSLALMRPLMTYLLELEWLRSVNNSSQHQWSYTHLTNMGKAIQNPNRHLRRVKVTLQTPQVRVKNLGAVDLLSNSIVSSVRQLGH